MRNRKSITRILFDEARDFFQKYPNDETRKSYIKNYKKYIQFCRDNFNCKTKEECALHIQEYSNHLQKKFHYTASTIHTYLACVCLYHDICLTEISKPKRHVSDYTRGRGGNKNSAISGDYSNPKYARIIKAASLIGIRRSELKRLKKSDLILDGPYPMVIVKRGKGGKKNHHQRIICSDDELQFLKDCFKGNPDDYVFERWELANKLNFHYLRAKAAQRAYNYFQNRIDSEGEKYVEELTNQIKEYWFSHNIDIKTGKPKPFPYDDLYGNYYLRGKVRQFAIDNGLSLVYDKLSLRATSCFILSHWRNDTTILSYLLVK